MRRRVQIGAAIGMIAAGGANAIHAIVRMVGASDVTPSTIVQACLATVVALCGIVLLIEARRAQAPKPAEADSGE